MAGGWNEIIFNVPSNPNHSVIKYQHLHCVSLIFVGKQLFSIHQPGTASIFRLKKKYRIKHLTLKQREDTALLTQWALADLRASVFEPLELFPGTQTLKRELPPNCA